MTDGLFIRPLGPEAPPVGDDGSPGAEKVLEAHPYPPFTQCTHPALGDLNSAYLQGWREKRFEEKNEKRGTSTIFVAENCSHPARVRLFGQPLCRRHAGMILLAIVESEGI